MRIDHHHDVALRAADIVAVFEASGISRPTRDLARIERMFANADIVLSAWHAGQLVGICRALTDFSHCCYLSDLAVVGAWQKQGVGRELVARTRALIGEEVSLVLLAAPEAMDYHPRIGFEKIGNGFIAKRSR